MKERKERMVYDVRTTQERDSFENQNTQEKRESSSYETTSFKENENGLHKDNLHDILDVSHKRRLGEEVEHSSSPVEWQGEL
jgi:hypothetical protein